MTLVLTAVTAVAVAGAASTNNYPAFLGGPAHSSVARLATTVTVGNASSLHSAWTWTPAPKAGADSYLNASPIAYGGVVYIGAETGDFYAVDAGTGQVRWKRAFPIANCAGTGITSTATVAPDPVTHALTVYVGAGDHYLYALSATTGRTQWRTLIGGTDPHYYNWSSPSVADGHVYLGVSTTCERPLGNGVIALDQHTGARTGQYFSATPQAGASVYSSVAIAPDGSVYASTGDANGGPIGDAFSIVELRGGTLDRLGGWMIPGQEGTNNDFNASPTLFTANVGGAQTAMVGACNKNGVFYALRQGALARGPVWTRRLGIEAPPGQLAFCGGAAIFDSVDNVLLVGANARTAGGPPGGVYALDPATGSVRWYRALAGGPVVGSPSLDGSGVLAAPTYAISGSANAVYLIAETTGAILKTLPYGASPIFAQPVFASGELLVAGPDLQAYRP